MAKQGANKSNRIPASGKGSEGEQPWFTKAKAKRRRKNAIAKASKRKNRNG